MAKRLATVYVKTCLKLTEAELAGFAELFAEHQVTLQTKVFENGNHEVVIAAEAGEEVTLSFERQGIDEFVMTGSCRFTDLQTANAMRKAVARFKGDAIVHRIYPTYTMVYHYTTGSVTRILELSERQTRLVFELRNTRGKLEHMYRSNKVEAAIQAARIEINDLLDQRLRAADSRQMNKIDEQLRHWSHRLFVMEA